MAGKIFSFFFLFVCVVIDFFPTNTAEIKQTLPQMTFFFSKPAGCVICGVVSLTRTTSDIKFVRCLKKQRNDTTVP